MATTTTPKTLVQRLVRLRPSPTILLFIATIAAVIIANTSASDLYNAFLNFPVYVSVGGIELFAHSGHTMTVSQVVNDALMAIFFFLVGLEIKQELLVGELSSPKKALLPIIAWVRRSPWLRTSPLLWQYWRPSGSACRRACASSSPLWL